MISKSLHVLVGMMDEMGVRKKTCGGGGRKREKERESEKSPTATNASTLVGRHTHPRTIHPPYVHTYIHIRIYSSLLPVLFSVCCLSSLHTTHTHRQNRDDDVCSCSPYRKSPILRRRRRAFCCNDTHKHTHTHTHTHTHNPSLALSSVPDFFPTNYFILLRMIQKKAVP